MGYIRSASAQIRIALFLYKIVEDPNGLFKDFWAKLRMNKVVKVPMPAWMNFYLGYVGSAQMKRPFVSGVVRIF